MDHPVVIGAVRTPVAKYMGALREVPANDLASLIISGQAEIIVAGGVESMSNAECGYNP